MRTQKQISSYIFDQVKKKLSLEPIKNNPSETANWKEFINAIATVMEDFEQRQEVFKSEIEALIGTASVHSPEYLREQVFKFQYDATTPQNIVFNGFVPGYQVPDQKKRIVSRCVVRTGLTRVNEVLVAKSEPPVKMAQVEVDTLAGYLSAVGMAGVEHSVNSFDPDKMFLKATVYFNGNYSASIELDVKAAIVGYLNNLGSKGVFYTTHMVDALQSVPGFSDIEIEDLAFRDHLTAFGSKTFLVQSFTTSAIRHETTAGYATSETEPGETFDDRLTFTAV